jgi:hypothetical protein
LSVVVSFVAANNGYWTADWTMCPAHIPCHFRNTIEFAAALFSIAYSGDREQ